jgi:hypothetical protein
VTRATLPELAVLTAFFVEERGHSTRRALSELSTTQQALFSDAHALAKSNAGLVRLLRSDPARVASGDYKLSEEKPWLVRLFEKKRTRDDDLPAELAAMARRPAATAPKTPDPARDELRALVDEAFAEDSPAE